MMVKVYHNEAVTDWIYGQIRAKMTDESRYSGPWHASALTQCLRKSVLTKKYRPTPQKEEIPQLAQGFALQEWYFGAEEDGVLYQVHVKDCEAIDDPDATCECPAAIFSADHISGDNIIEMKSTMRGRDKFIREDSINDAEGWHMRTRMYCAVHEINTAHIVVQFKGYPDRLEAWTMEFTDKELDEARQQIAEYLGVLTMADAKKRIPSVKSRKWAYECGYCPFYLHFCKDKLEKAGMEPPPTKKNGSDRGKEYQSYQIRP